MKNLKYRLAIFISVVLMFSAVIIPQMIPDDDVYGDTDVNISVIL
jgi:hypothetical protein